MSNAFPRLIGMVHVGALPTSPFASNGVPQIVKQALLEAKVLRDAGFDGVIVENMHDTPYVNGPHDPAVVSAMTRCVEAVVNAFGDGKSVGVQVLSRGEREAMAIAHACGAGFIRCENFVFAHVADEGLLADAAAGPLLRYRTQIGASSVRVLADIKKKHASHAITADVDLSELAKGAEFFRADGLIVTGVATGRPTDASDVAIARKATRLPVFVGSGATPGQLPALLEVAHGVIVGSWIKRGGVWNEPVDAKRAKAFVRAAK